MNFIDFTKIVDIKNEFMIENNMNNIKNENIDYKLSHIKQLENCNNENIHQTITNQQQQHCQQSQSEDLNNNNGVESMLCCCRNDINLNCTHVNNNNNNNESSHIMLIDESHLISVELPNKDCNKCENHTAQNQYNQLISDEETESCSNDEKVSKQFLFFHIKNENENENM